jgi:hypothetical protein
LPRGAEAFEELQLVEQHAQIRGKPRHESVLRLNR